MKLKIDSSHLSLYVYIIFLFAYLIVTSNFLNEYQEARIVIYSLYTLGYLLGMVVLFKSKMNKKSIIWIVSFLFVGLAVFYKNCSVDVLNALDVFNLLFLILCSRELNFDKAIKVDIKLRILATVVLFIFSSLGVISNLATIRDDGTLRYAFGYGHANRFGAAIFLIILYSAYVKRKTINYKDLLCQILAFFVVLFGANSRTAALGILAVFCYCIYRRCLSADRLDRRASKFFRNIAIAIGAIVLGTIFYGVYHYSDDISIYETLDKLFNSRLTLGSLYSSYYTISPFGTGVKTYTWDNVQTLGLNRALTGIDILYLKVFFSYGVVTFILYLYIMLFNIKYAAYKNKAMLFSVLLLCVVSCVENQYFPAMSNIFILLFAKRIYGEGEKDLSHEIKENT